LKNRVHGNRKKPLINERDWISLVKNKRVLPEKRGQGGGREGGKTQVGGEDMADGKKIAGEDLRFVQLSENESRGLSNMKALHT